MCQRQSSLGLLNVCVPAFARMLTGRSKASVSSRAHLLTMSARAASLDDEPILGEAFRLSVAGIFRRAETDPARHPSQSRQFRHFVAANQSRHFPVVFNPSRATARIP